jgi:hypothetical protein
VTGGSIAALVFLALALVLPALALGNRRIDFSRGWKMAAIWVWLFVLTAMLFRWIGM